MLRLRTLVGRKVALTLMTALNAASLAACDTTPEGPAAEGPDGPLGKADYSGDLSFDDAERNGDMVRYYGEYFVEETPHTRASSLKFVFLKIAVRHVPGANLEQKRVAVRWAGGDGEVHESVGQFAYGAIDREGLGEFEEWHVMLDLSDYRVNRTPVVFGAVYEDGTGRRFADYPDVDEDGETEGYVINPNNDDQAVIRLSRQDITVTEDRITGFVEFQAEDLDFEKELMLRYTTNDWRDCEDGECRELNRFWNPEDGDDTTNRIVYIGDSGAERDWFRIEIDIERNPEAEDPFEEFQFALGYRHPTGAEFWDNAYGQNYRHELDAEPEPEGE